MTEKKVKVPVKGKTSTGVEVDIKKSTEYWNEYELSDGTKLKIKTVVSKVVRTAEYNEQDEPIYWFQVGTVGASEVPAKLKKKAVNKDK